MPRALIIDDSPTMRQLLRFALSRQGCDAMEAVDGMDGLRKLTDSGPFDFALVDINMPVMDGFTMIGLLKKDPALAEIPIIVVTTEGDDAVAQQVDRLGVAGLITKPIDSSKVRIAIQEILQKQTETAGARSEQ